MKKLTTDDGLDTDSMYRASSLEELLKRLPQ